MTDRRSFLKSAAGLALAGSPETLPKVKFGKSEITRLIVGSNPFYGYSHFNRAFDQHMREWYTQDRKIEVLRRCERAGIDTWQVHYSDQSMADLKRYRAENGQMKFLVLMANPQHIQEAAKLGPLGIAHHGTYTDTHFRTGEKGKVREFLKAVRDCGVMVGLSTHNPAVVDTVESEGWDIDYYQTCLYRVTRTREEARAEFGEAPLGETFMEKDPERMCKTIRRTKRPCLAFKLLAAGRADSNPEAAFRFAFASIKPGDAAIVGMYPRFKDEVTENTELVRRIHSTMTR